MMETLRLDSLSIVCPGSAHYPLEDRIQVRGLSHLLSNQRYLQ